MTHRLFAIFALVLAFALAAAPLAPAWAQNGERVLAELQETDRVLEQAREVVGHALGPRPSNVLGEAQSLQRAAWTSFRAGRLARAFDETRAARRSALRAVDITKSQLRLLDRVRHVLATNDDLVSRAKEAISSTGSAEAQRLFDAGLSQLSRGRRAFEDSEYRQAVRHSLFGRDLMLRAIRVAEGGGIATKARVEEELRRTDEFLSEARAAAPDSPESDKLLREAERLQERATQKLAENHLDVARRLTLRARDAALDVLQNQRDGIDAGELAATIERVSDRLRVTRETLAESGDPEAMRLTAEAERHLENARRAQREGKGEEALAEAQLASSLLGQAEQRLR